MASFPFDLECEELPRRRVLMRQEYVLMKVALRSWRSVVYCMQYRRRFPHGEYCESVRLMFQHYAVAAEMARLEGTRYHDGSDDDG